MFGGQKVTIKVDGMSCQHCVQTVTDELLALVGVKKVKVDLGHAQAVVRFDPKQVQMSQLEGAVNQAGFQFVGHK